MGAEGLHDCGDRLYRVQSGDGREPDPVDCTGAGTSVALRAEPEEGDAEFGRRVSEGGRVGADDDAQSAGVGVSLAGEAGCALIFLGGLALLDAERAPLEAWSPVGSSHTGPHRHRSYPAPETQEIATVPSAIAGIADRPRHATSAITWISWAAG